MVVTTTGFVRLMASNHRMAGGSGGVVSPLRQRKGAVWERVHQAVTDQAVERPG